MSKPLMLPIDEVEALKGVIKAAMREVFRDLFEEKRDEIKSIILEAIRESGKRDPDSSTPTGAP